MIAIIVAVSNNNVIGNNGMIPWKVKGEQKRFKELTLENTVVMGRKSYEEIGRPLPGRKTIVISNTIKYEDENCRTVGSLKEALEIADTENVFIAGGERLYKEALPYADTLYITRVDLEVEGDTFFPEIDERLFNKTYEEKVCSDISYRYLTYKRNN